MSQENVELVRALQPDPDVNLAALVRDDDLSAAQVEAAAPYLDPAFECVQNLFGAPKIYYGPEGLRAMLLDWLAPWETYRSQIEETIDCGEQVVVLGHLFGRRQGSDREISAELADVWTVRCRKLLRWEAFSNRADALKAVGLEE